MGKASTNVGLVGATSGSSLMQDYRPHPANGCGAGRPRAYAWAHESDAGGRRYVAVLHVPPVDSPRAAVRAAIVQEARERAQRP